MTNEEIIDVSNDFLSIIDLIEEEKEEGKPQDTAKGKISSGLKSTEKAIHKKYFIDTHKLHNNVLEIRYNKNRHLTNVKTQVVGD